MTVHPPCYQLDSFYAGSQADADDVRGQGYVSIAELRNMQARIAELTATLKKAQSMNRDYLVAERNAAIRFAEMQARIAELEAQQWKPVELDYHYDDGKWRRFFVLPCVTRNHSVITKSLRSQKAAFFGHAAGKLRIDKRVKYVILILRS